MNRVRRVSAIAGLAVAAGVVAAVPAHAATVQGTSHAGVVKKASDNYPGFTYTHGDRGIIAIPR